MKKKILLIGCTLVATISTAIAQDFNISGKMINAPYFDTAHILMFSQNDYIYGTSRTAAMGGAFTSLGADLSSMNINPAGLGMYQSSDQGITQSLSINSMKTASDQMPSGNLHSGGSKISYGLNNVSTAWNLFNRSSDLTSFTMGFGYNRTANFNSRSSISTSGEGISIADMFYYQLNLLDSNKIPSTSLDPSKRPFDNENIFLDEWGAVLGYQTGVVKHDLGGYYLPIDVNSTSDSYMQSVTKGGLYEYTLSMGANINNFLYLGATLGVTQIRYDEELNYEEEFRNNGTGIKNIWYDHTTQITGSGFTMKLGAIVRPSPALRIGVAFHLPTFYTVDKSFESQMGTGSTARNTGDLLVDRKMFNSAPRLLTGISYVIAEKAILSVDYERTWYNKIHMRSKYQKVVNKSKNESKTLYKPANVIRGGLEIIASKVVSIRAGGSYSMNFMKATNRVASNPTIKDGYSITGGLGFNVGRNNYIDLAYIYNRANYTNYDLFYYKNTTDNDFAYQHDGRLGSDGFPVGREYTPRKNLHMITFTLGGRF